MWGTQVLAVKKSLEIKFCTFDGSHFQCSVYYRTHFSERRSQITEEPTLPSKRQDPTTMEYDGKNLILDPSLKDWNHG